MMPFITEEDLAMTVDIFASSSELPSTPVEPAAMIQPYAPTQSGESGAALDRDEDGRFATSPAPSPRPHWPRILPGL
jgi:hypothetical protein